MLVGRFGIIIPALALGRPLAAKNVAAASLGTFRTDNAMFIGLTIGVIVIIGGLTFFPAVSLGPIVEQLSHGKFWPTGSIAPVLPARAQSRELPLMALSRSRHGTSPGRCVKAKNPAS